MSDAAARNRLRSQLDAALARHPHHLPTPLAVVDLDAFDANAADLARRSGGTPIRVASKSLRIPALIERALARPGFAGVLAYTVREALVLHDLGVSPDIVVGYPSLDRGALADLVASASAAAAITVMVDDAAHLDVIDSVRRPGSASVRVALDVDAGLRLGPQHVGPKRSPLHDPSTVRSLARAVAAREGFRLVGVMSYEGQVAGVPDDVPGQRAKSLAVRALKRASVTQLSTRRREIAEALVDVADLEFFNAGGSGSVASSAADPCVTEVAAGSGLLVPALFDHYRSFEPRPAAFFGLRVTRKPTPTLATVHGGGLIASGPVASDRAPLPWAPPGLRLTGLEGAGEVQTPLTGRAAAGLSIGDLVWFRHAKSGELFEHVATAHLVRGDEIVEAAPTYRGLGHVL